MGDYIDSILDRLDSIIDFFADLALMFTDPLEFFKLTLKTLSDFVLFIIDFLYTLLFEDLWGTARLYGQRLLEFFFNKFSGDLFTFQAVEYIFGFIFLVFAVKLTINLIRG